MTNASALNPPFDTLPQQRQAATLGIWIFLATEVVFFSGMFLGYSLYRQQYSAGFTAAGAHTDILVGTVNTFLLLVSSATMAVAVWAGRQGFRRTVLAGLVLTAGFGTAFMVLKAIEYHDDFSQHLIPGAADFPIARPGAQLFFSYYWIMTAVHAVHLTVGVTAVSITAWRLARGSLVWRDTAFLHVLALYWHLIDVIWIFLFPLFYLLGR